MATVTGMTAEKVLELVGNLLVSAEINQTTGVLTVTTKDGQSVSAGNVDTNAGIIRAVDKAYPVGSIFMSVNSTNPASQLGVGTWTAWGTGRVPVAVDTAQTEFNEVEKIGGFKTHKLTEAEIPKHDHTIDHDHPSFNTGSGGAHLHAIQEDTATGGGAESVDMGSNSPDGPLTTAPMRTDGAHSHTIDVPNLTGKNSGLAGGDGSHNNLQPFITCYMWKRTA